MDPPAALQLMHAGKQQHWNNQCVFLLCISYPSHSKPASFSPVRCYQIFLSQAVTLSCSRGGAETLSLTTWGLAQQAA